MGLHRSDSRRSTAAAYMLVATQFLLLVPLLAWEPRPWWVLPAWLNRAATLVGLFGAIWLVLGAVALGRSLTALPLPAVKGTLRTRGLFRLSRHPIYTGIVALAWSAALRRASLLPLVIAAALTGLLHVKARFEERALTRAYPGYAAYAARTRRFLPLPRRRPGRARLTPDQG